MSSNVLNMWQIVGVLSQRSFIFSFECCPFGPCDSQIPIILSSLNLCTLVALTITRSSALTFSDEVELRVTGTDPPGSLTEVHFLLTRFHLVMQAEEYDMPPNSVS